MNYPQIAEAEDWLVARKDLLRREKELDRARDAVSADRRLLPMVRVQKDYRFTGPDGHAGLLDLFDGCQQLIVQHAMFDPQWDQPCDSCSAMINELGDGIRSHLRSRDTAYAAVSRAPYPKIRTVRMARGWSINWYSSYGSDFNYDFRVTLDPAVAPVNYNFRDADDLTAAGQEWMVDYAGEQPGISCFLRDGDQVFHTYSTYGRGVEVMMPGYHLLDITPLGRQEDWEEPKGRVPDPHPADPSYTSA